MKRISMLALLVSQVATADHHFDYSKKWGLGGSVGYNTPVFGHLFNDAADGAETWGLHGRYHYNSSVGVEAAFSRYEFSDVTNALKTYDVLFFKRLMPTSRLTPVLGLGFGGVELTKNDDQSMKLGLKARAGLEYALTHCLSLGVNVDYLDVQKMPGRANLDGKHIHDLSGRVGITWYWGSKETQAATVGAVAAASSVTDADSDNDGVKDRKDKCPSTPAGTEVNAYGCAKEEKASVTLDVHFASGKASLDHRYDADLKALADFMNEHPATKVEIQGHTDNTGSKALNKKLSQSRAEEVKSYLVKTLKVDESRLMAKGHGDENPIADNATETGKRQNRRVVAVIVE